MQIETDDPAIQSDAYIDALLDGHARLPIGLPLMAPPAGVRRVVRLLEQGLPRFHPSFLFEEQLAAQLRAAAAQSAGTGSDVLPVIDRRLLVGGAFASGVSIAGAFLAWRRRHV
jgi:hypothetical protein